MDTHRPGREGVRKTGLFANQNSATKLRNWFTLEQLTAEFGLDHHDETAKSD